MRKAGFPSFPRCFPFLAAGIGVSSLGLANCGVLGERPIHTDLVAAFEGAEVRLETRLVDFGTPEARRHLETGWAPHDEKWLEETTFVWGIGQRSSVRFMVFEPRELTTVVVCRPLVSVEVPRVAGFRVTVNGYPLEDIELQDGFQTYRLRIPAASVIVGDNIMSFTYSVPAGAGGRADDDRTYRVAWDLLRFERAKSLGLPRRESARGRDALILPYYSQVAYTMRVPGGAVLTVDEVLPYGPHGDAGPGTLKLVVRPAGSESGEIVLLAGNELPVAVHHEVTTTTDGEMLISFTALPATAGLEEDSGIMLVAPALRAPREGP